MKNLKKKIIVWLIKRLLGVKRIRSPIDVLWQMIDKENRIPITYDDGPNWCKIEAWEEAIERISEECFGG